MIQYKRAINENAIRMDLYKNNKIAFSLFIAIAIIATGVVYTYISSNQWSQPKVAEAQIISTSRTETIGTCKNTDKRYTNNCGVGCADFPDPATKQPIPEGEKTELWTAYKIEKTTITFSGNRTGSSSYKFISLDAVGSIGDKYNPNGDKSVIIGGSCTPGKTTGAYAVCCSGSKPFNNVDYYIQDNFWPPESSCKATKVLGSACPSAPTVNLTANPTSIRLYESSALTWSSKNATGCTGTNFGTNGKPNGTGIVSPKSNATYSVSCTGPGGSASDSVKVTVVTPSTQLINNGVCGSSNGVPVTSAPSTNLCSAGTASAVSGTGPWTWSCNGANGGATASCSAPKSLPQPPPSLPSSIDIKIN